MNGKQSNEVISSEFSKWGKQTLYNFYKPQNLGTREPFDNALSGCTFTFVGVGVGPDVYGGTSALQGVFSLSASSSLSSYDPNDQLGLLCLLVAAFHFRLLHFLLVICRAQDAELYLDVFNKYSQCCGGTSRHVSSRTFTDPMSVATLIHTNARKQKFHTDGAGDPFRSYSSLCLANAGKRRVVDSPRTAPVSSLHLAGSHCSKLLQKDIGLHATDSSRNVQNMAMNAEGSAFAHNEASDYIVSSVSNGVKRTIGKSQVMLTSVETNSLNRTEQFTPIDSNMSVVHSGELQRATRPVNAEGCTSAVATGHVVSSVSNPRKRTAANSQLMLTSVKVNSQRGHNRSTNADACSLARQPVGRSYTYVDLGDCTQRCRYCGAFFWYGERLKRSSHGQRVKYHLCCSEGRIYMQQPPEPPEYIKQLFQNKHFMENIRAYNQMFAMTSFGAKIDESINAGRGPYVFKVSGQVYHWIGSLCLTPKFLQLYIYDTENEVANRMSHFGGMNDSPLDPQIVEDSNAWSPEFVPFMGPKDGSGTVGSSKKLECSDKIQDSLEVADDEIISTSDAHFPPVRYASIETLKSVEHQDQPVDINMVNYDDAKALMKNLWIQTLIYMINVYIQNEESKYGHPSSITTMPADRLALRATLLVSTKTGKSC
ncbi:hypothetical protein Tco_0296581 [Tanacetum coccineum]